MRAPAVRLFADELIVDSFAGGGGASLGIEMALGRSPDVAINHDREAIAMHAANHPGTRHFCEDVWKVDPVEATGGKPVGLMWLSPDCKHFSKAKGGKPVEKKIRGLAWIAVRWAKAVRPRVIALENVEEFEDWGPLTEDGKPCPLRKGFTFRRFVRGLERLGYVVEHRELVAADYGAPTTRKRLFLIARCDGVPIVWPEGTHGRGSALAWRTAAECIDWSLPCPSIFERARPLADNTLRRIARGIRKYVIDAANPFIVPIAHYNGRDTVHPIDEPLRTVAAETKGGEFSLVRPFIAEYHSPKRDGDDRTKDLTEPLPTQTIENRFGLVAPLLAGVGGRKGQSPETSVERPYHTITAKADTALVAPFMVPRYGEDPDPHRNGGLGQEPRTLSVERPMATIVPTANHGSLVSAFMAKHYGGHETPGSSLELPLDTVTAKDHNAVVASHITKMRGTNTGQAHGDPLQTISAQGTHFAEVRAFLMKYYGTEQDPQLFEPMHTVTSKDRFGLVTVHGEDYFIADIGMRMLQPRELFRAQGFPDSYRIDADAAGKPFTKSAQVRMCGNSVCPPVAAAIIRANFVEQLEEVAA